MRFEQVGQSFVAEVMDVDLGRISDSEFRVLYKAWLEFGVLRIRGQSLNDGELQRFSNRFGPLEEIPYGKISEEEKQKIKNRYVTVISNIEVDGKPIGGLGNKEATWHSDMTYIEDPPPASILMSLEVPELGGDTHFSDQKAAYLSLPNELVSRIENLSIKHNAAHTSVGDLRRGFDPIKDPREAPGAIHPIVRTHDETQEKMLYLGRRELAYVVGFALEESEQLLNEVWRYAAMSENVWTQQWEIGDVIIWDNRRVLHRRDGFDQSQRRLMKRCQVMSSAA
ncbi:MAG: taurine catabolism dioxygenase TauD [Gammaproteobacteria bacterium]|nr:taurine catabolism dioxygenase TauD [Gammaproteobacteria bacterium]|tara:strand:- start:797 stop:1642 length:846 start_codon:yes stop_codon:yes gene_type:complete